MPELNSSCAVNWCLCHCANEKGREESQHQTWAVPSVRAIPWAQGLPPRRKAAGSELCEKLVTCWCAGLCYKTYHCR